MFENQVRRQCILLSHFSFGGTPDVCSGLLYARGSEFLTEPRA